MLDLLSTRDNVSWQAKADAQFIAAIIAHRVKGAAARPTKTEVASATSNPDALGCILYLFSPDSPFESHADAIGVDARAMRAALLGNHTLGVNSPFSEMDRRVVRARYIWWTESIAKGTKEPKRATHSSNSAKSPVPPA